MRPRLTVPAPFAPGTRSLVVLIGGYDGSGNYGDVLLVRAALGVVRALGPDVAPLIVVERDYADAHAAQGLDAPVAYFDARGEGGPPRPLPPGVERAAIYLYGGGYVNARWGPRKLAQLEAARALLEESGFPAAGVSSGLQVEPGWEPALEALRAFAPVGVRDALSAEAVATLGARETGDDAVGVLASAGGPAGADVLVHLGEHGWVSDEPAAVRAFMADVATATVRARGAGARIRPVVAYDDDRVTERASAERLALVARERGLAVAEPLVLGPAAAAGATPAGPPSLAGAAIALSCSYHVALTSLLLGVPAALVRASPYYDQKAQGLLDDFALPAAFAPTVDDDPAAVGAALAEAAGDAALLRGLRERAAALARRRQAAEEALADGLRATLARSGDGAAERRHARHAAALAALERLPELEAAAARGEALEARMRWYERQLLAAAEAGRLERAELIAGLDPDSDAGS